MPRLLILTWTLLALGTAPVAAQPADSAEKAAGERGLALATMLATGQYEELLAACDDQMAAALGGGRVDGLWKTIEFQIGAYQKAELRRVTASGLLHAAHVAIEGEHGTAVLRLVLADTRKLTGLWIDEITPKDVYKAPDYVKRERFTEEEVVVRGAVELPATLSTPTGPGPHPAVVLVHGSGPHDRDETIGPNRPFRDLAWGLASSGVAVLRYDKRTKVAPTFRDPDDWTLDDEVIEDALAAVALLRRNSQIDARRVFVAGHSLGGFAAPLIAERDAKLAGIILLAGTPRPLLDLVVEQFEYIARLDGEVSPEAKQQIDDVKALRDAIRAGEVPPTSSFLPPKYVDRLEKIKPAEVARRLATPMLILHAGRDYQVTSADLDAWREAVGGRRNVTIREYPTLNHLFVAGEGPSRPEEYRKAGHVDGSVIADIATWIGRQPPAEPAPPRDESAGG